MLLGACTIASAQQPAPGTSPPAAPATTTPAPDSSQPAAQCAATYYRALDPLRRDRAPALADLIKTLRAGDAVLPGRWLFSTQLFQKSRQSQPKAERICLEAATVRGQTRCIRYGTKPAEAAAEIATRAKTAAEDLRALKALSEIVETRVAIPDVSANGKQTFLVQRLSQDLRLYVTQAETPVLCSGAGELTEFYAGQLASIRRRLDELKSNAKKLADLAAQRTREIAVTEGRMYDAAVAAAKVVTDARARLEQAHAAAVAAQAQQAAAAPAGTPPPIPVAAPVLPPVPALPPKPAAPAALADYAVTSLSAQIAEALRPLLPSALVSELAAERDHFALLARAQKALLDPAVKADVEPAREVRDAAIAALRLHEGRLYADRYAARYGEIDALLSATIADIRTAHRASCTCQE